MGALPFYTIYIEDMNFVEKTRGKHVSKNRKVLSYLPATNLGFNFQDSRLKSEPRQNRYSDVKIIQALYEEKHVLSEDLFYHHT